MTNLKGYCKKFENYLKIGFAKPLRQVCGLLMEDPVMGVGSGGPWPPPTSGF